MQSEEARKEEMSSEMDVLVMEEVLRERGREWRISKCQGKK